MSGNENIFNCTICEKPFKTKWGLNRHLRVCHGLNAEKRNVMKYKCPFCGINVNDYEQYSDHVFKSHKVRIQMQFFKFESQSHFLAWKRKVEKETKSSYVKETKRCTKTNKFVSEESKPCITKKVGVIHYRCHRSGYFRLKDESKRKRRLRALGSAKINAYCPAKISAQFKRNGSVKVVYCSTHVGHECEVSYLKLTEDERRDIVAKIAAKVPFDDILDEIRNAAGSSDISKMHLLSKRDLWRISHSSYFKKYSQSVKSLPPSKSDISTVELSTDNKALQDSHIEQTSYDMKFDDIELQTFDPNESDSDSDISSNSEEFGNNQSEEEDNISHSSVITHQQQRNSIRCTTSQGKPNDSFTKLDGLNISQKQSQLIEKFRTNVSNLTSSKEIRWVENHINRMFVLLKSLKDRTEIRIKDTHIRHKGKIQQTSNSISNQHSKLKPSNKIHQASQEVKKLPVNSKSKLDVKSCFVKCPSVLKTGQQKSICNSIYQISCNRKDSLKPLNAQKTESLCSAQIKQYLVPIAGKPDKFLIVQTKPDEPPPVGPLTPVSHKKPPNNKNAVIIDHSYSL